MIVDPVAADVVQQIFQLFAEGISYVRITKIPREKRILNPQAYFNQNNPDYFQSEYWRKPFDWHATSVRSIMNNPVYLGKVVFGRRKTKGFFDKSIVDVPEQDWIVVDNTHEPIITQEVWDTVHQIMKSKRTENSNGEVQMFAGLVKCSGCGSSLNASYSKPKGKYTDMLVAAKSEKHKREIEKSRKELKSVKKRMGDLEKILNKLYEDLALERITESRYQSMAPQYESELEELRIKEISLTQAVNQAADTYSRIEEFLPIISKYTDITELNTYILNELIERIIVHEKTVNEDGSKSQRVDIYYKFVGYIKQ